MSIDGIGGRCSAILGGQCSHAAFSALPELTEANLGLVVNVTEKLTTTDSFVEGAGQKHPAGTNVVVVQVGDTFKYDV